MCACMCVHAGGIRSHQAKPKFLGEVQGEVESTGRIS